MLIDRLQVRDPAAFKMLRHKTTRVNTPITADTWHGYLGSHFGNARTAWEQRRQAPTEFAVVGTRRNSPPPGVPTLDEMTAMVGHQLGKLRSGTAAGLEGLPAEFLKYATVRQVDERG